MRIAREVVWAVTYIRRWDEVGWRTRGKRKTVVSKLANRAARPLQCDTHGGESEYVTERTTDGAHYEPSLF